MRASPRRPGRQSSGRGARVGGMTDYERIGGERALRAIVEDFVDRVSRDMIVGFFFAGKDLGRIIDKEFELAAARMGGPFSYTGLPLARAHKPLGINRGHLRRRLAILRHVLESRGVDPEIAERWISHERGLEAQITDRRECSE